MNDQQEISPEALELVAARFRVLSEPVRLRILQHLERGESSVTAITKAIGSTQPNVSKHLKILQDEDLVARRQDGNSVFYRIGDETVLQLCKVVCGSLREKFVQRASIF